MRMRPGMRMRLGMLALTTACSLASACGKEQAKPPPQKAVAIEAALPAAQLHIAYQMTKDVETAAARWFVDHDQPCPASIADLTPYLTRPGDDPWGHPLVLRCDSGAVTGVSFGPDGRENTADDILSSRPPPVASPTGTRR